MAGDILLNKIFININKLHFIGFWNDECKVNTTFFIK